MGEVRKWAWYFGRAKSASLIWQLCRVLCYMFDFVTVDVTQFSYPISEQVVKIHHRFAVHDCGLRPL